MRSGSRCQNFLCTGQKVAVREETRLFSRTRHLPPSEKPGFLCYSSFFVLYTAKFYNFLYKKI
ncbi:Uncharacterized protein dnm_052230 [Desulfonema magnum]|uniref:Uncharacterized protein n=1 Tax=Desulfonema magnum TaxID=45655 RepID=A0A975GQP6_9BACT|nr:Uncharacterized protein dnm_052230 [Desulfonema magnum]